MKQLTSFYKDQGKEETKEKEDQEDQKLDISFNELSLKQEEDNVKEIKKELMKTKLENKNLKTVSIGFFELLININRISKSY